MARDFVGCQREQILVMAPRLSDSLPEDHLVWTVSVSEQKGTEDVDARLRPASRSLGRS
jgi:hypothetical protein